MDNIKYSLLKALSHSAIFLASFNADLLLGDTYFHNNLQIVIFLTYQTFVTNLHLLRVELLWMLQGELPCDRALRTLVICIHMLCMVNFAAANIYYLHENALTCDLNKNYMTTDKQLNRLIAVENVLYWVFWTRLKWMRTDHCLLSQKLNWDERWSKLMRIGVSFIAFPNSNTLLAVCRKLKYRQLNVIYCIKNIMIYMS